MRFEAAVALLGVAAACGRGASRGHAGPEARCQAMVAGVGEVPIETVYLPRVVNCENGAAAPAALRAQAVAARTYLYYELGRVGQIDDGTSDQVFGCGREPGPEHFAAVAATAGEVLLHGDAPIAAFYVAGALQAPPACTGGAYDPTATEPYVTYNLGRAGADVLQSPLGRLDPGNAANRGCLSQNGSDCLARAGRDHRDILRFYYGEDIAIERAAGACD